VQVADLCGERQCRVGACDASSNSPSNHNVLARRLRQITFGSCP
jgi:hypothetical protein